MMRTAALASLRRLAAASASARSPAAIRPFSSLPHLSTAALRHNPLPPPPLRPVMQHVRGFFAPPAKSVNYDDVDFSDPEGLDPELQFDPKAQFFDPETNDFSDDGGVDDLDESGSGSDLE